jgi:TolB protein
MPTQTIVSPAFRKIILFVFAIVFFSALHGFAQVPKIGDFSGAADIGKPKIAGSAKYDHDSQAYYLKGAGYNIWFNRDEFQFLYHRIGGDFLLTADFAFISDNNGDPHRKVGWMLRESLDEAAAHVSAVAHGDGLTVMQWRKLRGAFMRDPEDEIFFSKKAIPKTIQLERIGKKITMRVANMGEPLQIVGSYEMENIRDTVFAGLYICSHNPDKTEEVKISNVRIDKPLPESHNAYRMGWPGSRLEVIDVGSLERKVIHQADKRFEAPNWMPDGKRILFNQDGFIYTIPVEGGVPEKLNTGDVAGNNNDHGISFDGKMLAISSHRQGLPGGGSTIYVLPLTGGTPKLITEQTPSYWHGWVPGNKEMLFVGQRNNSTIYNIYKVNISDGKETAVTTNSSGHVDGPEYSPDGKYIYFNGNASGTMQIWRMKPDGSAKEQLTFDEYQNWFPHISPDGKWLAFISFPVSVASDDHPPAKKVMLRLMPVQGGAPRVLAHLYGGQGSLNVNSWSPDSKRLAFVSNSELKSK